MDNKIDTLLKYSKNELISMIINNSSTPDKNIVNKIQAKKNLKRKSNQIDWNKYNLRHIALEIMYDGKNFHGFTAQNDQNLRTVEKELFYALKKCHLIDDKQSIDKCAYSRCGRTDKGVSATGQIVSLVLRSKCIDSNAIGMLPSNIKGYNNVDTFINNIRENDNNSINKDEISQHYNKDKKDFINENELEYDIMLNNVLPNDICILSYSPVPLSFSARFSCIGRTYKYIFYKDNLNINAMKQAAKNFIGNHDFRNFCCLDMIYNSHFNRTIIDFTINPIKDGGLINNGLLKSKLDNIKYDDLYIMTITGNAFLYHQVRCMVSILFMIGQNKEKITLINDLLNIKKYSNKPNYNMANEIPLILYKCYYPTNMLSLRTSYKNSRRLYMKLHHIWRKNMMQTKLNDIMTYLVQLNIKNNHEKEEEIKNNDNILPKGHQLINYIYSNKSNIHKSILDRPKQKSLNYRINNLNDKQKEMRNRINQASIKYRDTNSYKYDPQYLLQRYNSLKDEQMA